MRSSSSLIALALAACTQHRAATSAHHTDASDASDRAHDASADRIEASAPPRTCAGWTAIAQGITQRSCAPASGHTLVAMAGWRITTESTQRWVDALDRAALSELGFDSFVAVEGPRAVDYRDKELALDALLASVRAGMRPNALVLVVAHSSGAHVARTFFHRAFSSTDGAAISRRALYVDLDGDLSIRGDPERSWSEVTRRGLRWSLFAGVEDPQRRLRGFSRNATEHGVAALAPNSERWIFDASDTGCTSDVCAHLSLINTRPYARGNESYSRFEQGPVNTGWLQPLRRYFQR